MKKIKYPCDETGQEYASMFILPIYCSQLSSTFEVDVLRLVIQTKSLINKFHVLIHNFFLFKNNIIGN